MTAIPAHRVDDILWPGEIGLQQKPVVAVGEDAIVDRGGKRVVFIVRDGHAVAVPVTPGTKIGDTVAIDGEMKPGEKAVAKPESTLASGALVRVPSK